MCARRMAGDPRGGGGCERPRRRRRSRAGEKSAGRRGHDRRGHSRSSVAARVQSELGGRADLVTSDLAPKLSGIAARDEARSRELIMRADIRERDAEAGRRDGREVVHGRAVQGHRRFSSNSISEAVEVMRTKAAGRDRQSCISWRADSAAELSRAWHQIHQARKVLSMRALGGRHLCLLLLAAVVAACSCTRSPSNQSSRKSFTRRSKSPGRARRLRRRDRLELRAAARRYRIARCCQS